MTQPPPKAAEVKVENRPIDNSEQSLDALEKNFNKNHYASLYKWQKVKTFEDQV